MTFVRRIETAVSERQRGEKHGVTRVRTRDLQDLLHHFKRLPAEAYNRHCQERDAYRAKQRP